MDEDFEGPKRKVEVGGGRMSKQQKVGKNKDGNGEPSKNTLRDFKAVHANILKEKLTLAVYDKGIRLAAVPENAQPYDDQSNIGWDIISRIVTQKEDEAGISLKECFQTLTPASISFLSAVTENCWGYRDVPVASHIIRVSDENLGYITSALVSSTSNDRSAKTCMKVYQMMTAPGALTIIRKNPYYVKARNINNELKAMWGSFGQSSTQEALNAIQTEYAQLFAKEASIHKLFKIIAMAMKDDRYKKAVQIIESGQPHEKIKELGDFKETNEIMMMSPSRDDFLSYLATTAVNLMTDTKASRSEIIFPPRMDKLIDDATIKLDKNRAFQDFMKTALGIDNDSHEIASKQSSAAAELVRECYTLVGASIFRGHDICSWSDDDFTRGLAQKIVKGVDGEETKIGILTYTDNQLKEIHMAHKLSTEYKNIQWKELILETYKYMKTSVQDSIASYINRHKVVVCEREGFGEHEYSPMADIFQLVVKSMFLNEEEFEHITKPLGKPARFDKVASEKCVPITLTFDHVDIDDREEVAKQIYEALKGIPKIVQTFGCKFLFYVRNIDLASTFVVSPIYSALKDEVFGKMPKLMGNAPYLARDFLFLLCQAAAHPDAITFTMFADKIVNTGICYLDRSRFIYQEPSEGGDKYHKVDTSATDDMVVLDEACFKVIIYSATAKTLDDFDRDKVLEALNDEEISFYEPPMKEANGEGEEDGNEETDQTQGTWLRKPIPDNQFLSADDKAEIQFLKNWIHAHLKDTSREKKETILEGIHAIVPRIKQTPVFEKAAPRSQFYTKILSHAISILKTVNLSQEDQEHLERCSSVKKGRGKNRSLTIPEKVEIVTQIMIKARRVHENKAPAHDDASGEGGVDKGNDSAHEDVGKAAAGLMELDAGTRLHTQEGGAGGGSSSEDEEGDEAGGGERRGGSSDSSEGDDSEDD